MCRDPQEPYRFEFSLGKSTTQMALQMSLRLLAYKVELRYEVKVTVHPKPVAFTDFTLIGIYENGSYLLPVMFTHEANFNVNGYVNRYNGRILVSQ
jgi:hypothetical protein